MEAMVDEREIVGKEVEGGTDVLRWGTAEQGQAGARARANLGVCKRSRRGVVIGKRGRR